jgi:hypothetical protein
MVIDCPQNFMGQCSAPPCTVGPSMVARLAIHGGSPLEETPENWIGSSCGRMTTGTDSSARSSANYSLNSSPARSESQAHRVHSSAGSTAFLSKQI